MQGEELQCAVYLGITKGGRFGFGEGAKFTGTGFDACGLGDDLAGTQLWCPGVVSKRRRGDR